MERDLEENWKRNAFQRGGIGVYWICGKLLYKKELRGLTENFRYLSEERVS